MKKRTSRIARKTRETDISLDLNLDGSGKAQVKTGLPFLDHMLELLIRHSLMDARIRAKGDLAVDYHHTVEDIGLVFGAAINEALGDRKGIVRYGCMSVPMDEAIASAVVDLGGRPYLVLKMATKKKKIRDFDLSLIEEFFRAFVVQGRMNLHVEQKYGDEPHHACEAVFKAVARALRTACAVDSREKGVPSTKGNI